TSSWALTRSASLPSIMPVSITRRWSSIRRVRPSSKGIVCNSMVADHSDGSSANVQPMSCTDDVPVVEREVLLPAPPDEVWESLPAVLGEGAELDAEPGGALRSYGPDGEHVGVVEEVEAPRRLTSRWTPVEGDDTPSLVGI